MTLLQQGHGGIGIFRQRRLGEPSDRPKQVMPEGAQGAGENQNRMRLALRPFEGLNDFRVFNRLKCAQHCCWVGDFQVGCGCRNLWLRDQWLQ